EQSLDNCVVNLLEVGGGVVYIVKAAIFRADGQIWHTGELRSTQIDHLRRFQYAPCPTCQIVYMPRSQPNNDQRHIIHPYKTKPTPTDSPRLNRSVYTASNQQPDWATYPPECHHPQIRSCAMPGAPSPCLVRSIRPARDRRNCNPTRREGW